MKNKEHQPDCNWGKTTINECEFRNTHYYCPHPEHACTCTKKVMKNQEQSWESRITEHNGFEETFIEIDGHYADVEDWKDFITQEIQKAKEERSKEILGLIDEYFKYDLIPVQVKLENPHYWKGYEDTVKIVEKELKQKIMEGKE